MIRQENVTSRDLELLNIALDHALTPQEQAEFNKRLTECPYLTTLFQQQRRLKDAMEQLPCYKVPRNFTLTRVEARKAKRAGFLQPVFGWASLISALLVAVIFGSELIFRNVSLTVPMSSDNPQTYAVQEDSSVASNTGEEAGIKTMASAPIYLLNWGYGATGLGGIGGKGGGGGGGVAEAGGVSINIYINPNVFYSEEMALEGAGAGEIAPETAMDGAVSAFPEEAIPEQEVPSQESLMATPIPLEHEAPRIYGIDTEKAGTILKMTPDSNDTQLELPSEEETRTGQESESKSIVPIQVRIGLVAAALVFGLVWWYLKFKR